MIVELGHYALCLALVAAALQAVTPLWGVRNDNVAAMRFGDSAAQVQFLATLGAFAALTYAYVVSDFSVRTVALNSHSAKPLIYRITGVWANHEGSMLLWVLVLALFGAAIATFARAVPLAMRARVLAVQAMIGVGFFAFILLTSNPFERLPLPPMDGQGMNPLLQDPGIALHPPFLYIGYVGFSTAFSFAIAALMAGKVEPAWARWMRPWVLGAWAALTFGIALGSWWAYYELGWGGFWFWDPVENASFMPWLLGTALLHSAIVVEKRDALQRWTILLAIFTFSLSLMGTFLVRSGILSSVHAFANDPERGAFILVLLAISLVGSMVLFAIRAPAIRERGVFSPISREGGLLLNNLLLAAACGVVFVGTLYPLLLDIATGDRITVGAPYFNQTFGPIFALVAIAAAIGPFLSWKRADARAIAHRLRIVLALSLLVPVIWAALTGWREPLGLAGLGLAAWLFTATLVDLGRRAGIGAAPIATVLRRLVGLPRSAWGLYAGHAGLAICISGVVAISVWKVEAIQTQQLGSPVPVGGYEFTLVDVSQRAGPNYQSSIATVAVSRDGEQVGLLFPERRWYPVERKPTTEAGIRTLWHGDLYAVLGDPAPEGQFVTRYYYNPGVAWMWLGATLMALGGLLTISDRRLRVGAPGARKVPVQAQPA
ncbi:MAG: heme lyase CcmF/NrfE family subunit [Paracoccaceae bacterium]|nr:heme lyase CcmF/NrfE family subunit [Paracoccaceae bacterium]